MPNILIVAYTFPPDFGVGAKRALRIAEHLSRRGWGVRVLTVRPGYYEGFDPTLLRSNPGFEVIRSHALTPKIWARKLRAAIGLKPIGASVPFRETTATAPRTSVLERISRAWDLVFSLPDEWAGWIPPAFVAGWLRTRRADIILATGPPFSGTVAATMLARAGGTHLVLDYRDPWTTFPSRSRWPSWRRKVERALEKRCLSVASLVVTTTKAISGSLTELGATRTAVVPNSFDPELMRGVEPTRFSRFTLVYAGNFYGDRSPEPVLRAMEALRESGALPPGGIALRVLGASGPEVSAEARRLGMSSHLEIEDFVPYREALARMKGADVLLLVVVTSHAEMVPAKLFEYLAARRFILALAPRDSEAARVLAETDSGVMLDPSDIPGIMKALTSRFTATRQDLPNHPGLKAYEASATMQALERLLLEILQGG